MERTPTLRCTYKNILSRFEKAYSTYLFWHPYDGIVGALDDENIEYIGGSQLHLRAANVCTPSFGRICECFS